MMDASALLPLGDGTHSGSLPDSAPVLAWRVAVFRLTLPLSTLDDWLSPRPYHIKDKRTYRSKARANGRKVKRWGPGKRYRTYAAFLQAETARIKRWRTRRRLRAGIG